jgi:hypothetical protein
MTLPPDVNVALSVLQVTGLVLPVVFIALRPFYTPSDDGSPDDVPEIPHDFELADGPGYDAAPLVIKVGVVVAGLLVTAAVLAGARVAWYVLGSWLTVAAVVALSLGITTLGVLLYLIRRRFLGEIEAV